MNFESLLEEELNKRRPKVNKFEQIFDRMQTYKGVFGVTFITDYKLFKTSLPEEEAEDILAKWMPIVQRLERNIRENDITDGLRALQVTSTKYDVVIAFGYADGDFQKMYGIMVHQITKEPLVTLEKREVVRKFKDPRDHINNSLVEFRKKMWIDKPPKIFDKDSMLLGESRNWLLEGMEEIKKIPEGRGWKKKGKEVKIFHDFLSRCQVSPPDPKTGKSKWTYLEKPVLRDYDIPDLFTQQMAKEFTDAKEEVDVAAEDIEELIDKGALAAEEGEKKVLKRQLEKHRRKILLSKMEQLRKKRFNKNWQKRCFTKKKN